jgi:hypothetical protein
MTSARFVPILFLAATVLSACVSDSTAPAPPIVQASTPDIATIKAEREATSRSYVLCLMRAAKKLDDRKSDPHTIAEAMISVCAVEFDANVEAHSRYLEEGLTGRQKVATALRETSFGTAIQFVLSGSEGCAALRLVWRHRLLLTRAAAR